MNCSMDYKTSYARRKDLNFGPIIIQFLKGTVKKTSLKIHLFKLFLTLTFKSIFCNYKNNIY